VEVRDRPVEELVEEIKQAHGTATFAQDPALARARYREVEISADQLLRSISPNQDPINYIELCFLMHEALSVLNRNDEALWYGKRSRLVAESIDDPQDYRLDRERLDFFLINSMRAEAVAFHNLKLYRDAFRLCQMAEETDAMKRTSSFWKPHLYRDTINALEGIPRFSITHVENLSHQVRQICETRNEGADGLLSFLILGSLARAYIKHQNFKDAQRVLTMGFDRLSTTANLGPLHLVIFFRMYARLYSARGDYGSEWEYFAQRASDLASQAGLEHQLSEMCAEFGVHYEKVKLLSDEHLTR